MMRKSILKQTIIVQRIITKKVDIDITKDKNTEIRMNFPKSRTENDVYVEVKQ